MDEQAVPTCYAAFFADDDRSGAHDLHQPALFDAQPSPADVAAAQPLHSGTHPALHDARDAVAAPLTQDRDTPGEEPVATVHNAVRQAQILADLRAEINARAAHYTVARRAGPADLYDLDDDYSSGWSAFRGEQNRTEQAESTGMSL